MRPLTCLSMLLCLLMSACVSIPTPAERRATADALAQEKNWQAQRLTSTGFDLIAYLPKTPKKSSTLTVYVEGDGFAWITPSMASADPTPRDPLALRLALAHPDGNAAYLGRACQFIEAQASGCSALYWTGARFAADVVTASNEAIGALKRRFQAERLVLVGYSGGAAIASLVAGRRQDVVLLVSVAGNLDTRAWTRYHQLQALDGSLNPINMAESLQHIPQIHFAGGKDRNITPELVFEYAEKFAKNRKPVVIVEASYDHQCCWAEHWPALWRKSVAASSPR